MSRLRGEDTEHYFYPIFNEIDSMKKCDEVFNVVKSELLPYIEKMKDTEVIDKLINQGDEIWGTDWNKIITLRGNFNIKRLIIAYLVGGIEHMEEVNLKENSAIAKLVEQQGTGPLDPSYKEKLDNPVGYTLHYLRSLAD